MIHNFTHFTEKNWASFADRVLDWMHDGEIVREGLAHEGPLIIDRICTETRLSLRALAARAGLSPTYVSMVRTGKTILTAESFIKFVEIENELAGEKRRPYLPLAENHPCLR